jgi:dipeptidyl aminopeptidase/acylaminoacyl peptidase
MLLSLDNYRGEVWVGSFGEPREKNLTVFGNANVMGISADGRALLDDERDSFYLLRTDGTPPKKLGDGFASELSPDGKWAAVVRPGPPSRLVLVPTGAGEEKTLQAGNIEDYDRLNVRWSGDGRTLLFGAHERAHGDRLYLQDVSGGPPRPLTPDGLHTESSSISPDGRFVLVEEDGYWIYAVDGGPKRPVSGLRKGVDFVWRNWSADGRYIYAWDPTQLPFRVSRVELTTGKREPWKTIMPQDPVGIWTGDLILTPDGKSYAYNCSRDLSDLFLVEGIK